MHLVLALKVRTYDYKKLCSVCDILNGLDEFSLVSCPFKVSDRVGDKKRSVEERVFLILKGMDKSMYSYLRYLVYDAATCHSTHAMDIKEQDTVFKCAFDSSVRSAYCSSDPAKAYEYSSKPIFSNSFFKSNCFFGSVLKSRDKRTLEACLNIQSVIKYSGLKKGVVRVYGVQCNMPKLVRALTYAYRDNTIRFELEGNSDNFGNCGSIPYAKGKCEMVINCKLYSSPKRGEISLIHAHDLYAADLRKYVLEADRVFSLVSAINQLNVDELCVPTYSPESGEAFVSLSDHVGLELKERARLFTKACYLYNTSGVDLVPVFFKLRSFYNVLDCEMPEMASARKDEVYDFVDVSVDKDYADVFSKASSPIQLVESGEEKILKIETKDIIVSTTATTSIKKVVEQKLYPALDATGFVIIQGGTGLEIATARGKDVAYIGEFGFELGQNGFKLEDGFLQCVKGVGGELTKNRSGIFFVKGAKKVEHEDNGSTSDAGSFESESKGEG